VDPVKRARNKGTCHEHFILAGERGIDPKDRGRGKPEPGVISRVPDNDDDPVSQTPAGLKPFFNKTGSYAPALVFREDRKRRKGYGRYTPLFRFYCHRGKEDMSDNLSFMHGNKREPGDVVTIVPEGTDKPGFAVLAECFGIDIDNGGDIFRDFRSDKKRIHPVL
jgi:hypothetical protein